METYFEPSNVAPSKWGLTSSLKHIELFSLCSQSPKTMKVATEELAIHLDSTGFYRVQLSIHFLPCICYNASSITHVNYISHNLFHIALLN